MRKRFSRATLDALDAAKYLWIRAGSEHRFVAIWVVVTGGRAFVRAYYLREGGWQPSFLEDPRGEIRIGAKDAKVVRMRALPARGEKMRDAVDAAYLAKYNSDSNLKFSRTFGTKARRAATMELLPR